MWILLSRTYSKSITGPKSQDYKTNERMLLLYALVPSFSLQFKGSKSLKDFQYSIPTTDWYSGLHSSTLCSNDEQQQQFFSKTTFFQAFHQQG